MFSDYEFSIGPVSEKTFNSLLARRRRMAMMGNDYAPSILERPPQIFPIGDIRSTTLFLGRRQYIPVKNLISIDQNVSYNFKIQNYDSSGKPEAFTFYDEYRGAPRFNLVAHGKRNGGEIVYDDVSYGAEKPIEIATAANEERGFSSIRLLSCYGGKGGEDSLAFKISKQMRMPVKSYKGTVTSFNPLTSGANTRENIGVKAAEDLDQQNVYLGRLKNLRSLGGGQYIVDEEGTVLVGAEFFGL